VVCFCFFCLGLVCGGSFLVVVFCGWGLVGVLFVFYFFIGVGWVFNLNLSLGRMGVAFPLLGVSPPFSGRDAAQDASPPLFFFFPLTILGLGSDFFSSPPFVVWRCCRSFGVCAHFLPPLPCNFSFLVCEKVTYFPPCWLSAVCWPVKREITLFYYEGR